MKRSIPVIAMLFLALGGTSLAAEDFFLFGRTSFIEAQFWERQEAEHSSDDDRKVMSNVNGGSIGLGVEWTIWDIGKKRGSRIFLLSGVDLVFLGLNYMGENEDEIKLQSLNEISVKGGAMYTGTDIDLYFGGTFPRTDLKWGFGSNFYFMFNTYAPIAYSDYEKFVFFATPSIFIAYDIFIGNTKYKITPMLKTGLTCVPLIPDDYMDDVARYYRSAENWYSGVYIDLSVSVSFKSFQWKK